MVKPIINNFFPRQFLLVLIYNIFLAHPKSPDWGILLIFTFQTLDFSCGLVEQSKSSVFLIRVTVKFLVSYLCLSFHISLCVDFISIGSQYQQLELSPPPASTLKSLSMSFDTELILQVLKVSYRY